jgi:N-acetylmuramic acid 6-phosphate etherase
MVDVRVSNIKLRARGHRLIRTVCKDTTLTDISLDNLIATCGGSVKLAIVVLHNQWTVEKGRTELDLAGGRLENVLVTKSASIVPQINCTKHAAPLFLCIDGGGTLTRAIITALDNAGRSTVLGKGFAGPSNISAVGIPAALSSISIAIQQATSTLPPIYTTTPHFSGAWIGCAGIDTEQRPSVASDFTRAVAKLLSLDTKNLRVTSDAVLLGAIVSPGIILISGTGSIAMRFNASGAQVSRAGGLGYLLGDEGSGYDVGRLAIRHAIATPGNLRDAVMLHFHVDTPAELVNTVYAPAAQEETPKERISGVAPIVLDLAFCEAGDATSMKILHKAAKSLTSLIMQVLDPSSATHIASTGGLLKNDAFRFMLQETLESAGYVLPGGEIVHVQDPGEQTALVLAARGGVYS